MKSNFTLAVILCLFTTAYAQDDLLKLLEEEEKKEPQQTEYVINTFKATRIINGYSTELTAKKNLQFVIAHRFGSVNSGWREFFGIDDADMRIGLEYGIYDWWNVGIGRSSVGGTVDLTTRVKFMRQSKGAKKIPFTLAGYANMAFVSKEQPPEVEVIHRISYAYQLMLARKFTKNFSFQVMPSYIHRNLTPTANDPNGIFSVGAGLRYLVSRSIGLNLEYFQPITKKEDGEMYIGSLGFGIDIETGGHVFQVTITNSRGMIDQLYIPNNSGHWWDKEIHIGFNINRNITFGAGGKKTKTQKDLN